MMGWMRRAAVIDMGSNSFRLVVYGYEPREYWHLVDEIREAVRVGEGVSDDGRLQPEPMERAVRTASMFAAFCRASGIDDVTAVATSAIRDAENGPDLLARVRDEAGLEPRVLSGEEEARYGYLAIANSTTLEDGYGLDIGGGSVQVMRLDDRRLTRSGSWPLGAVRMSERFLPDDEAGGKQIKALRKHVRSVLEDETWIERGDPARAAGIGGTIRNLASAAERRAGLPQTDGEGFSLTREALDELIDELAGMPASKRGGVPGIKPDRGDVILAGAVVLSELMERCGAAAVEATGAGLREGVFFERFLDDRDEPLVHDVRRASVFNLANRYMTDMDHPEHVARLSLSVYDALGEAGLASGDQEERDLLWAACLLHDIGTAVDYDDHHKHSRYLILNGGLPGYSPREVELIALIARYHRKGDPDASELGPLKHKHDDARLELLSGVIRLTEQLERSRDGSVSGVRLTTPNGAVRLEAETRSDASVAIWSARRNADLLAKAIDRPVENTPAS
jgi:exopolyphosphatase/guanosine-5'-triphosphate,3'-diphosphate pyrophosphatase